MNWVKYNLILALRVLIPLIILSITYGCSVTETMKEIFGSGVDNTEPPSPLVKFTETATIKRLWSEDVGSGTDELFIKLVPALLDTQIYVADSSGKIAALDIVSGKTIWEKDIDLPITGGPGADASLVMVGTSEGDVVSLSTATGEELWRATVSSEILSSPRESDNIVAVRTIDGKIFAIDATTGERLWVYDRTVPALTLRGTSTPVIANELVIAGFDGGRVTALELKTGKLVWEKRVAIASGRSELERMVDIDAQPLLIDGVIYLTTYQANISALAIDDGQILWQRDISSHTELAAAGESLFVTDQQGHVWALDRFSGASIWKQEKLQARQVTGPVVIGNKVVVGDLEGYLHWLDKESGAFTSRSRVSAEPILTPAITADNVLFAYASDGTLSAYTYTDTGVPVPEPTTTVEDRPATLDDRYSDRKIIKKQTSGTEKAIPVEKEKSLFGRVMEIFTGADEDEEQEPEQDNKNKVSR